MKKFLVRVTSVVALVVFVVASSGCGIVRCKLCPLPEESFRSVQGTKTHQSMLWQQQVAMAEPVVITVTGYGAPDERIKNKPQQILMAMRASEVDAYRTLAERIRGVQISATTKVSDFVTDYDHLRAVVDGYIHRARVGSQGLTAQGYYETSLSLTLDQNFFQSFSSVPASGVSLSMKTHGSASGAGISTLSISDSHYDADGGQRWAWFE